MVAASSGLRRASPADSTYQRLLDTRCEDPLTDEQAADLIDQLEGHILSRRQAEFLVYSFGQRKTRREIAGEMGVSVDRVSNLDRELRNKLRDLDETTAAIRELRESIRRPLDQD